MAPRGGQHEALAAHGGLVGEPGGHSPAQRVAHEGGGLDAEHAEQVAHAVGVGRYGVVGAGLSDALAQQVGGDDRVVAGEGVDSGQPALRAVIYAVQQ
jgi:hypothetical protein